MAIHLKSSVLMKACGKVIVPNDPTRIFFICLTRFSLSLESAGTPSLVGHPDIKIKFVGSPFFNFDSSALISTKAGIPFNSCYSFKRLL
jgi:hypothetical protein